MAAQAATARASDSGASAERAERELNMEINTAIAGTEAEIFEDALGNDPLDNDGDNSLEQMGDGLEGDDDESETDEDAGDEADEEDEDQEQDEEDDDEAEDDDTAEAGDAEDDAPQPQDQRPQANRRLPPDVVPRQELDRERQRRRSIENEVNELKARLDGLVAGTQLRQPAQPDPKPEPKPKPDMFADPEGYERWVMEEADRRADAKIEARMQRLEHDNQAREARRLDENLSAAAQGPRGFEFQAAYGALTALDPKSPEDVATVRRITSSQDPAAALFAWWDENGGPEYRENIAAQLGLVAQPRQQVRQGGRLSPQPQRMQPQPRNVVRVPASLNGASGGGSKQIADPELYDDSESSVFDFATRR